MAKRTEQIFFGRSEAKVTNKRLCTCYVVQHRLAREYYVFTLSVALSLSLPVPCQCSQHGHTPAAMVIVSPACCLCGQVHPCANIDPQADESIIFKNGIGLVHR